MSRNARTISPYNSTATSPATTTMTITVTPNLDSEDCSNCTNEAPKVLRLKLERKKERQNGHITWSEDTIDNENLNKKKSNLCCIFHPNGDVDHDSCDHGKEREGEEEEEIPAGKNVYEFQPKYKLNKK